MTMMPRNGAYAFTIEGIIPAIETSHAFAVLEKMDFNRDDIIIFNCSGRGDKDLDTYIDYFKL